MINFKYPPWLLAVVSGLLLSFSWLPNGFVGLLFFALLPLFWLEHQIYLCTPSKYSHVSIFKFTYIAFLIFNAFTTYWIYNASPFGAISAIIINALYPALIFALFHFTKKILGVKRGYWSFLMYWLMFEYLHQNWDLSWTWLNLGNAFANNIYLIQWYEYTGVLGGTLWILLSNIFVFQIFIKTRKRQNILYPSIRLALLIVLPILFSVYLFKQYKETGEAVNIVIVQPNIDPYNEKFEAGTYQQQIAKILKLAASKVDSNTQYIVAPETAITEDVFENDLSMNKSLSMLRSFVYEHPHLAIVTGASSFKYFTEKEKTITSRRVPHEQNLWFDNYNTALQIDTHHVVQIYHKSKLVPGVEMLPFPNLFRHFQELVFDLGGTVGSLGKQSERSIFTKNKIKIAPIICYESVYGEYVAEYVLKGAQLFFIMTNDGWWGNTPGYKQHLAYARLRAIEHRRSIARSANTGISAFINQRGQILAQTKWWEAASIKGNLFTNNQLTFYTSYGDYIGRVALLFGSMIFLLTITRSVRIMSNKQQVTK